MKNLNGIKIMNLEGSDILKNNLEGLSINKDYKGVFATSLLGDKLIELGLKVNKGKTKDIIMINFNYGYTPQTAKSIVNDILENKNDIDKVIADKKALIDKRKELTLLKKPYTTRIKELIKERKLQKNNEDKKSYTEEIARLNEQIKGLKCADDIKPHDAKIKELRAEIKNLEIGDIKKELEEEINVLKKSNISKNQKVINNLIEDTKTLKELTIEGKQEIKEMKLSKEEIRDKLYQEGFHLDFYKQDRGTKEYKKDVTIDYVFWYRSPSKSKTGNVCFINKQLHEDINFWQTMGIELPSENAKLVELEAYKSLTSSAIESKIIINPFREILVVNDLDSFIEEMCNKVFVHRHFNKEINIKEYKIVKCERSVEGKKVSGKLKQAIRKNRTCAVEEGIMKIKNTIYDGMALISDELFSGANGMMVLRQHFFKVCGFRTYISKFMKQWCKDNGKDYNTYTIKDRYGREIFIKDIKCITTENAMKWERFSDDRVNYEYWCSKVQEDNNLFGVCKIDHESKYLDKQRMSFQMINTLPIDAEKTFELCKDTIEYVESLKSNDEVFITHLKRTKSDLNSNAMIIDLYENNKGFYNSELFRKFKVSTISEYKETLRAGKLLTESDNLTVCGNPYSLLLHSVGELDKYITGNIIEEYEDPTLPTLEDGVSVYTTRFENEELCAFRSPHNSPNNILFFINQRTNQLMDTYFPFSKNIIAVDLFNTNCQSRGNGFDEDSDFFYVTNNEICIEGSKKAQSFNTIENCIEQTGKKYNNTMEDLSRIDNGLAKSRYSIGLSSNLAQLAMSWYWYNPKSKELADIVCIMSVLAQCSIDNSKRAYMVNLEKEIARISKLDCMQVKINDKKEMVLLEGYVGETKDFNKLKMAKPYFWKFIKEIKEKEAYKITENEIDTIDKTEEEILELKKVEKSRVLELKVKQKQKNKKKKSDKEIKLIGSCIENKICPMDFIQSAIDTIKVNKDNKKYTKDIDFIQVVEGTVDKRQQDKVIEIVKELDDMYKKHFDDLSEKKINTDDEEWENEQLIKTTNSLYMLEKIKLSQKTMQTIVASTLCNDNSNKKYKRRMLNCLYKSQKKIFMNCFTKKLISTCKIKR